MMGKYVKTSMIDVNTSHTLEEGAVWFMVYVLCFMVYGLWFRV
jgi:hypothetical protein